MRLISSNVVDFIEIDSHFIDRREVIRGLYPPSSFEDFTFLILELSILNLARDEPESKLLNISETDC